MGKLLIVCFMIPLGCAQCRDVDNQVAIPGCNFVLEYEWLNDPYNEWELSEPVIDGGGIKPRFAESWTKTYSIDWQSDRMRPVPPFPDDADCVYVCGNLTYGNLRGGGELRYLKLRAVGESAESLARNIGELGKFKKLNGLILELHPGKSMRIDMSFAGSLPSLTGLEIFAPNCILENVENLQKHNSLKSFRVVSDAEQSAHEGCFDETSDFVWIKSFENGYDWHNLEKLDLSGAILADKDSLKRMKNVKTLALPLFCGAEYIPEGVRTLILSHSGISDLEAILHHPNIERLAFFDGELYRDYIESLRERYCVQEEKKFTEIVWRVKCENQETREFKVN